MPKPLDPGVVAREEGVEHRGDSSPGGIVRAHQRAASTKRQSAFASRICSTVRQFASSSRGLATRYARHFAREIATLRRFRENRKSRPRGTSSPLELAIE